MLATQPQPRVSKVCLTTFQQRGRGTNRLMIGATARKSEKQQIAAAWRTDDQLVIGTHALIEDPVTFADLELAIVDEQHRFGVEQRAALALERQQSSPAGDDCNSHIPSSLALTVLR